MAADIQFGPRQREAGADPDRDDRLAERDQPATSSPSTPSGCAASTCSPSSRSATAASSTSRPQASPTPPGCCSRRATSLWNSTDATRRRGSSSTTATQSSPPHSTHSSRATATRAERAGRAHRFAQTHPYVGSTLRDRSETNGVSAPLARPPPISTLDSEESHLETSVENGGDSNPRDQHSETLDARAL
jgi:hypothetical protein